jgi:hypothetical protein
MPTPAPASPRTLTVSVDTSIGLVILYVDAERGIVQRTARGQWVPVDPAKAQTEPQQFTPDDIVAAQTAVANALARDHGSHVRRLTVDLARGRTEVGVDAQSGRFYWMWPAWDALTPGDYEAIAEAIAGASGGDEAR